MFSWFWPTASANSMIIIWILLSEPHIWGLLSQSWPIQGLVLFDILERCHLSSWLPYSDTLWHLEMGAGSIGSVRCHRNPCSCRKRLAGIHWNPCSTSSYAELNADCIMSDRSLWPLELQPFENKWLISVLNWLKCFPCLLAQRDSAVGVIREYLRWPCTTMNISSHSSASGPVFMEIFKAAFTWPYIGTQALAGIIAIIVWRKYFYTISDVPGPFFASFTRLWHLVQVHEGDQNLRMIELHDKHGRFTPG